MIKKNIDWKDNIRVPAVPELHVIIYPSLQLQMVRLRRSGNVPWRRNQDHKPDWPGKV